MDVARDRYHSPTTTTDTPSANARARTRRPVRRPPPTVPVRISITVRCNRIPRRCPPQAAGGVAAVVDAVVAVSAAAAAVAAVATAECADTTADAGRRGLEVYGDSAYGTGAARAAYRGGGHDTVIKPKPLRPAVPGGFTLDDFTIDEPAGTATCPGGYTRAMTPNGRSPSVRCAPTAHCGIAAPPPAMAGR